MKTRDIVLICMTIIILLIAGIFILSNLNSAEDTTLTITSNSTLNEGGYIGFKLTDANGSAIPKQIIEINFDYQNGTEETFRLRTNSNGECRLEDLISGNFTIDAKFNGTKKYKESTAHQDLTVNKLPTKSKAVKSNENSKKSSAKTEYATDYKVDEVVNGWDPSEHEVSREYLGDGNYRVNYDDGYFRVIDKDGNILNYGY